LYAHINCISFKGCSFFLKVFQPDALLLFTNNSDDAWLAAIGRISILLVKLFRVPGIMNNTAMGFVWGRETNKEKMTIIEGA